MDRRSSGHTVSITFNVPIEVAEYLAIHGDKLIAAARHAVTDFANNPPADIAEAKRRKFEDQRKQFLFRLNSVGRKGSRLFRAIERDAFAVASKPKGPEYAKWKRQTFKEIASLLHVDFDFLQTAIPKFNKDFRRKLKNRRRREVVRSYRNGLSNTQIASRYGWHPTYASRFLSEARTALKSIEAGS